MAANIKIYQLKDCQKAREVHFCPLAETRRITGGVDFSIYEPVFEGFLVVRNLDEVFELFNSDDRPNPKTMTSLSVSDIVSWNGECYFVDSFGFQHLDRDAEDLKVAFKTFIQHPELKESRMGSYAIERVSDDEFRVHYIDTATEQRLPVVKCIGKELSAIEPVFDTDSVIEALVGVDETYVKAKLRLLLFEPGCEPKIVNVPDTLEDLQQLVGGLIEPVYLGDDFILWCNEESLLEHLPFNRCVYYSGNRSEEEMTGIFGNFYISGCDGKSFEGEASDVEAYIESYDKSVQIFQRILNR